MFKFESINASYEFSSCVTFVDGHKSSFRKVERLKAENTKEAYVFTMLGTSEEMVDGKEPEEWGAIILHFGKELYPYSLLVSDQGDLLRVQDFERVREHWMTRKKELMEFYEHNFLIKKEAYRYALALKTEEKFLDIIRRNMFYKLLFWQDNIMGQEVEIRDFPAPQRLAIFTFQDGKEENDALCFETACVHDEGSDRLLSGKCTLRIHRAMDGLPAEVSLWARVEEQDTGYFIREITIRRL